MIQLTFSRRFFEKRKIVQISLHLTFKIVKEIGDKAGEGNVYCNLGSVFHSLGDFQTALDYHELCLKIAKELTDEVMEGRAYSNLANALQSLGDVEKAVDYYNLHLKSVKERGDKVAEGSIYGNLGNAFHCLGDLQRAINYHNQHLKIANEVGDKAGKGGAYGNLGTVFNSLGDIRKSIEYHNFHLKIAKEVGDKAGEGHAYDNLGGAFHSLGDFQTAISYHNQQLEIAQELGDKVSEGSAYGNLGTAFQSLGDFHKAVDYHKSCLKIAKEVKNKNLEGQAYTNLGIAINSLDDFETAQDYFNLSLKISKEIGNKIAEGSFYCHLGNTFQILGDYEKAINYYNSCFTLAKETGDKNLEGSAHANIGNAFYNLGDFKKSIDRHNLHLRIAKETGNKTGEAKSYHVLGESFESLGRLLEAQECYMSSVKLLNELRSDLHCDKWKIGFRDLCHVSYTRFWRILLRQDKTVEALFAAEEGRAQALTDLMASQFGVLTGPYLLDEQEHMKDRELSDIPSSTVFQAIDNGTINFWVFLQDRCVQFRQTALDDPLAVGDTPSFIQSLIQSAYNDIGVRSEVRCENRSLDALQDRDRPSDGKPDKESDQSWLQKESSLRKLYDIAIKPITNLVRDNELIIVPDGPLWLAPYAAFLDDNSKSLCESFRIRLIPSLTSLKIISECPKEHHEGSGVLLVGDPWVAEVTNKRGKKLLQQLKFAKQEVEMIGEILKVTPLTGEKATKPEVLNGLSSAALVHIAAHGRMETGEIALAPDPKRVSRNPTKEDYILTITDVMNVKMRAKLVVLSCCHSGRGEIKAEGVVGIARAFMGAGARSVLVSLWAIDDEATLQFMRCFYHHLVEGRSASESLNRAMKSFRESDKYGHSKYWAPFVLIGDDVTLDFTERNERS